MQLRDVSRMAMMMRMPITVPTIVIAAAAAAAAILIISSIPLFSYQVAYSQMTTSGPQNLSSLFKNFKPQKDVSGHYNNPQFGITDIVFPDGWHGRELPPIIGLTVIMHPGNENESSSPFAISSLRFTQPQMLLQVINNSDLAALASEGEGNNPGAFSISKICKPLAQNTTSVIDGKTFNVATVECPLSSLMGSEGERGTPSIGDNLGNNGNSSNNGIASSGGGGGGLFKPFNLDPNASMQAKLYEFKGSEKTYRLAVIVSNLFTSDSQTSEKPDISKYTQLLDSTANTLKFR
jgi:hypothetical protein